jgi:hypothetical protein
MSGTDTQNNQPDDTGGGESSADDTAGDEGSEGEVLIPEKEPEPFSTVQNSEDSSTDSEGNRVAELDSDSDE